MLLLSDHTLNCIEKGAAITATPGFIFGGAIGSVTGASAGVYIATAHAMIGCLSNTQRPQHHGVSLTVLDKISNGLCRGFEVGFLIGALAGTAISAPAGAVAGAALSPIIPSRLVR